MTFAWYGHPRFRAAPLGLAIGDSWFVERFEDILQGRANMIGYGHFSAPKRKTIRDVITLTVFAVFSVTCLKEPLSWNHAISFALILAGAFFIFLKSG